MAEKVNITAQNEKTFQSFQEKLSVLPHYIPTARRFAKWLGVDKAYYLEARPRIIDILLTAEGTLRTQGHMLGDQYPKMANAFIDLVHAVAPFQRYFVEPNLQASVRHLLGTVAILQAPHPAASQAPTPPPPVPMHATRFPSTSIDPSQQMRSSSSSLAAALTPIESPTTRVTDIPPPPARSMTASASTASRPVASAPTKQDSSNSIVPSVANAQALSITPETAKVSPAPSGGPGSGSGSAPVPPAALSSKPKRKAKKKGDDISNLMQVDLQKYNEKRVTKPPEGTQIGNSVSASSPVEVTQTISKPPVVDPPSVLVSLPESRPSFRPPTAQATLMTNESASAAVTQTFPMSPTAGPPSSSVSLPRSQPSSRALQDTTMRHEAQQPASATQTISTPAIVGPSSVSVSLPKSRPLSRSPTAHGTPMGDESKAKVLAPAEGTQSSDADVIMNNQTRSEDVDMMIPTSSVQDDSAMNDEVSRVLLTLTCSVPSEVAIAEAVEPTALKSDEVMPAVLPNIEHDAVSEPVPEVDASVQNTSQEKSMDMDLDSSQENLANESRVLAGKRVVQSAHLRAVIEDFMKNINVEDLVNNANKHIASNTVAPSPTDVSLELGEFSTADLPLPNFQEVSFEDVPPSSRTGLDGAAVIVQHRGLASGSITIKFTIKQNQMDAITKWNDRFKHSDDLRNSLCLSLLCFAIPDLKKRLESSPSNDLRNLLPEFECSWPKNGGLNMDALWNGQRITFPMSPPFALPPNGLVDVSPFLVVGENTLCIIQTRDMSGYWLLLCAHHPTPSQLNAVARRRYKERNWSGWLESISQPLQLPFSVPIKAK
ncbi:hypothetical protein B0H12DRAFT_1139885 [Mycena haematopus]|nr:hypothetical protein B0H12DRAFT_1139885 [Mycena haematopus]